jgi:hypothetical protein
MQFWPDPTGSRAAQRRCVQPDQWFEADVTGFRQPHSARAGRDIPGARPLNRLALAALPLVRHQAVARQRPVQNLTRDFDSGDRETGWIQLADLHQNRSLIPVDMLAHKLSVSELRHHNGWDLDRPVCRWNAWQQKVDDACMGELDDHLIDNTVRSNRAAYRGDLNIGRVGVDEMVFVKSLQFIAAYATGHRRDVVDIGVGHHGVRRGICIARDEFRAKMLVPDCDDIVIWH